jgi:hypothetical protein
MLRKILNHFNFSKNTKNITITSKITNSENPLSTFNKRRITYFDNQKCVKKSIGHVEYNKYTGCIYELFITNEEYRNLGLGSQILENIVNDMKNTKNRYSKNVWLSTSRYPHPFWEKKGFTYKGEICGLYYYYKKL